MDTSGLVTRADGSTYRIPKCVNPAASSMARLTSQYDPTDSTWIEYGWDTLDLNSNWYTQLTAQWTVPNAPLGSYSGIQAYYAFPALSNPYVGFQAKAAVQYGYNGVFGGSYWTMASWACCALGSWVHSTPDSIGARDSISGSLVGYGCSGGGYCDSLWITTKDVTRRDSTRLRVSNLPYSYWAAGGAVQVLGLTSCDQYPIIGVSFPAIYLLDKNGWSHNRTFVGTVNPNHIGPFCSFSVNAGQYSVSLAHNPPPPLSVTISGPSRVRPNASCRWTAIPSGGVRPISYSWVPAGTQQDSSVIEAFSSSGTLTVYVTDSVNQQASKQKSITVSSSAPACPNRPVR